MPALEGNEHFKLRSAIVKLGGWIPEYKFIPDEAQPWLGPVFDFYKDGVAIECETIYLSTAVNKPMNKAIAVRERGYKGKLIMVVLSPESAKREYEKRLKLLLEKCDEVWTINMEKSEVEDRLVKSQPSKSKE